jgi:hypothetical protein
MKQNTLVTPRIVTVDRDRIRREGRGRRTRIGAAAAVGFALSIAIGACNAPGPTTIPGTSVSIPSINSSAAASLATQAALAALDVVDTQITANTSATGLTADDASSLTQLTAAIRTALQTGDMTAARTAIDNLDTKAQSLASKLSVGAGPQLAAAIAALKAALPAS